MKWIIGVLLVAVLVVSSGYTPVYLRRQRVELRDHVFTVERAVTSYQKKRGLMFRDTLPDSTGMALVYDGDAARAIWMHNMRFSIDAVWVSADNRVVDVAQGMQPEKDTHTGSAPAQYVVELPAGAVARYAISVGDSVTWR